MSALLPTHLGADGRPVSRTTEAVETLVHWLHGVASLGWGLTLLAITFVAVPRLRSILSVEGRRWLDVRLEPVILAGGVSTAVLVATGVYNLKKSTPYPTPFLDGSWADVREAPDAKAYFATLAVKLVVYVAMLAGAGLIVRRAREVVAAQATTAPPRPVRWIPAAVAGGGAVVLLCVSLLGTLHLRIEGAATPVPDPLTADHAGTVQPLFSKVGAKAVGSNGWDVTFTLTDLHTKHPVSGVLVSVTGTAPGGAAYGPVDFGRVGRGQYRGRVAGPAGAWELFAVAVAPAGKDVPPTQQSFRLQLGPKTTDSPTGGLPL